MKKHLTKFIAAFVLIVVAVTMVAMGTYAWFVISTEPTAKGMKVSVGSAENITILIAPDRTDEHGNHYPGDFAKTLDFSEDAAYDLSALAGLAPVSTADGVNWYGPVYADISVGGDRIGYRLLAGDGIQSYNDTAYAPLYDLDGAPVGAAEAVSALNLPADGDTGAGSYICLDFWAVSPEQDYALRVATKLPNEGVADAFDAGSFALELPAAGTETVDGQEVLTATVRRSAAEASLRVGFLVDTAEDQGAKTAYLASASPNRAYQTLHGAFGADRTGYAFTIYEPNGDLHPGDAEAEGSYLVTSPWGPGTDTHSVTYHGVTLENVPGIRRGDVRSRLTVQGQSAWAVDPTNTGRTLIEKRLTEPTNAERDAEDRVSYVIGSSLSGQLASYVLSGGFVSDTASLYTGGAVDLSALRLAGATTGVTVEDEHGESALQDIAIVTLAQNEPQRIRMYIWIEGEDADCGNAAVDSSLLLNVELAGASVS